MSAPKLLIVIEVEHRPCIAADALNEGEQRRLDDWIAAHDDIAELVAHALTVVAERREAA